MKILFVLRNLKVGGGTTFVLRAALGLIARGHQIEVAAQNGAMKTRFEAIGARVHILPPTPFNRFQLRMLARRDFGIIHACNPTAGDDLVKVWPRSSQKTRPALVLSIHGNLPDYVKGNLCLFAAAEVLTFDQSALDRLRKIGGIRPDIHLMPRPVEGRDLKVGPKSPPHVVMVSRLSKTKGPAGMAAIEAVESLESRFPGLCLTIFGEGSARDAILSRAQNLNQKLGREAVRAPGSVTDPFEAMQSAAVVVGTSYVALEALFHAIPVVAAGYEGYGVIEESNLDEAVACNFGDGFPGVQPKVTAEWLRPCFERVLTHFSGESGRAELERMRARLEKNHSLDAVAARLESIYQKALDAAKSGGGLKTPTLKNPTRRELELLPREPLHIARNNTKADVYKLEWPPGSGRFAVLKDMAARPAWFRLGAGRWFIGREFRALRALDGIEGVPRALARPDADCVLMEWRAGTPIMEWKMGEVPVAALETVARIVAQAHARGVIHGDLHRSNVLLTEAGQITLIDWATAGVFGAKTGAAKRFTFEEWKVIDIRAVAKLKARHAPESVSQAERDALLNGSKLYRTVRGAGFKIRKLFGHQRAKSPELAAQRYKRLADRTPKAPEEKL